MSKGKVNEVKVVRCLYHTIVESRMCFVLFYFKQKQNLEDHSEIKRPR